MVTWITPVDVTPGTTGSWVDVDVSANISASATGVIIIMDRCATSFGFRKNGSTDNRLYDGASTDGSINHVAVGVDGSGIFEVNINAGNIILMGYFEGEANFFTNGVDKTLGSYGSWIDIDVSSDTGGDTAIGGFFEVGNNSSNPRMVGFRKNGSTDNRTYDVHNYTDTLVNAIVGFDGSEICEGYAENANLSFYFLGYMTDGASFHTNGTDVSLATTGSYQNLSTLASGATGGFYELNANGKQFGLRGDTKTYDYYGDVTRHNWGMSEAVSQVVEGKIEDTTVDFWEIGYTFDVSGEEIIYNAVMFGTNF